MTLLLSFALVQNAFADIFNDATANGTYLAVPVVSGNSFVSTPVVLNTPTVDVEKTATLDDQNGDGFAQLGETISYSFSIQNTGNVTLSNITLSDLNATITGGPIASLAPNAIDTTTFSGVHTLIAADLTAGSVTNTATVVASPPSGPAVNDVDVVITTLSNAAILAADDTVSGVDGVTGNANAINIFTNDTLNGSPATLGNVTMTVSLVNPVPPELTFNPLSGVVGVPAATPAGSYDFAYTICETLNPTNCDDGLVTITVGASVIVANADTAGGINGAAGDTNAIGIFDNDLMNGVALDPGDVDFSILASNPLPPELTVDPLTGIVAVLPGTPTGVYDFEYQVCETLNPANCATAVVTITVSVAVLVAIPDAIGGINGVAGDTDVIHVFDDDLFNGLALDPADVTTTVLPSNPLPPELTFDPLTGIVGVAAGTPAGIYDFEYQICETLNPANCVSAVVTVTVVAAGTLTSFTKQALVTQARRGEQIAYVITATDVGFNPALIVDIMPPGFDYVAGSATVNSVATEPVIEGRSLSFDGLVPDGGGDISVELILVATVAVTTGEQVNKAQLIDSVSGVLAGSANATVTIIPEHVFDCGDVIGKVFDDRNRDGSQDGDEPGLAGVRLVTVKGVLITTDKHGRFHVACADIPDADIGSNFILKLDTRTLPSGFKMTTANPRIVRLTAGKMSKLNFGASITRLVRFDMTEEARSGLKAMLRLAG